MKLNEIAMIDNPKRNEIVKWAQSYDRDDAEVWLKGDATFNTNKVSFSLLAQYANQKFIPPVDSNWWSGLLIFTFNINTANDNCSHLIKNFDAVPNAKKLWFVQSVIESLDGIEKLSNLETIRFTDIDIKGPLLKLLKCKKLKSIDNDKNPRTKDQLSKALVILNRHLKEKDIVECQGELIDAGLDEYAKL